MPSRWRGRGRYRAHDALWRHVALGSWDHHRPQLRSRNNHLADLGPDGEGAPGQPRTAVDSGVGREFGGAEDHIVNKPEPCPARPLTWGFTSERVTGIEPALSAWEAL